MIPSVYAFKRAERRLYPIYNEPAYNRTSIDRSGNELIRREVDWKRSTFEDLVDHGQRLISYDQEHLERFYKSSRGIKHDNSAVGLNRNNAKVSHFAELQPPHHGNNGVDNFALTSYLLAKHPSAKI
ncbi:hypothetical protein Ciccas_006500 [Cichlidogyrus casuarinus]|uniref:Uncharacterized protein n=1 Tax=Cichlidogyrus casuarinus TaxID=1844966 RepID=A0ABD2Q6R5_9PLAT